MILHVIFYVALIIAILYLLKIRPFGSELFTTAPVQFIQADNTEFRGINLLGDNSTDGHFAASNVDICRNVCGENSECKGYSFYQPGQRCYMFMSSGGFVGGRPGFTAGKKIE